MSRNSLLSLKGVFPPIPTPFTAAGDVDYVHLHENLTKWNTGPLDGYVVLGSNGEYVYLSPDERVRVVNAARESIPTSRLLIAGSGMEGTRETIDLSIRMAEVGADAAIVVTPNYYKAGMTAVSLEHHYNQIADACPIPVILYNVPVFTGLDMPAESVINLSKHPNIIGIKESSSNIGKVGLMVHGATKDFQVLTGSASGLLGALAVGAVGGVMALANIAAPQIARLIQYFEQGNLSEALAIQLQLIPANIAVTAHFGIPGLKAALDMLGYYGGPARSPLMTLPEADKANLRVILSEAGIL